MIDAIADIVAIAKTIEPLQGRVYRRWPKKTLGMPCALVSRISRTVIQSDRDGREVIAALTYSIDINAKTQDEADTATALLVDALARYNFHSTLTDFYDDVLQVYRVIITASGTVDKRGNTFTGGY